MRIKFETTERISSFDIFKDGITNIILSLDPSKVHGHDGISIRMLKICAFSMSKPLLLLFKHSLENECFQKRMEEIKYYINSQKGG